MTSVPDIPRSEDLDDSTPSAYDSTMTPENSDLLATQPRPDTKSILVVHLQRQKDRANKPISDVNCEPEFRPKHSPKSLSIAFIAIGWLRCIALISISAIGIWPLILQLILNPSSVFGDDHGDRYQQMSYFAMENGHYQILQPRELNCTDLKTALMGDSNPVVSQDLVRAVPYSVYQRARSLTASQTDSPNATVLSVLTDILSLSRHDSLCFGGIDNDGSMQIEALLSAQGAPDFGLDAVCLPVTGSHLRLRLLPTEFYYSDTMAELNPARTPGALMIVSLVDQKLKPVLSSCLEYTRQTRFNATTTAMDYQRLVSQYSHRLLVTSDCRSFDAFGGVRDAFGCAYSALGASGAVADLLSDGVDRSYSFPAPWSMIQCTVSGECSSLQFPQMWLSERTVETVLCFVKVS